MRYMPSPVVCIRWLARDSNISHWWTISLEVIWCTLCQSYIYISWWFSVSYQLMSCGAHPDVGSLYKGILKMVWLFRSLEFGKNIIIHQKYRYLHFRSLLKNRDYHSCRWGKKTHIPAFFLKLGPSPEGFLSYLETTRIAPLLEMMYKSFGMFKS